MTYEINAADGDGFIEIWNSGLLAFEIGPHLNCSEAESLAAIISALAGEEAGALWIKGHASGDEDEDDMHHDLYLANQEDERVTNEFAAIVRAEGDDL